MDELDKLTPFAVTFRYDDDFEIILDRQHIYEIVRKLSDWAENSIAPKLPAQP